MRTLVLGGTAWLGHAVATAALERGHAVTCLARGESGSPPDGVTFVKADRTSDRAYDDVTDQDWDLVMEVSWQPGMVRSALDALAHRSAHWSYVSSCSVYAAQDTPGADETAALLAAHPFDHAEKADYGEAKVACEVLTREAMGDRALIARSGVIGGYGDPGDRFGYWPARFSASKSGSAGWAQGDPILIPDAPRMATQVINYRDLADWLIRSGENRTTGVYNASGELLPFEEIVAACRRVTGADAPTVGAEGSWLLAQGIKEFAGERSLPLWIDDVSGAGFSNRDTSAAVAAGLTWRPIDELVSSALKWEIERGLDRERKAGISPIDERQLLTEWAGR